MGKIKNHGRSLKWKFLIYMPICFIIALFGSFGIGVATNHLQDWYRYKYPDSKLSDSYYELHINDDNNAYVVYTDKSGAPVQPFDKKRQAIYWVISNAQMIIVPAWIFFCILMAGFIFYDFELKEPIDILLSASKRIADNDLDFKVEYKKQNELGMLCGAFDEMRSSLYESNREMWRSLEERKRLGSAFSHDLRTPLTVLKGYGDFLEKYVPDGKVSEEKLMSVISMMNGQIVRLEHYTQKMNSVQKLEDIVPECSEITAEGLSEMLTETGTLICGDRLEMNSTLSDMTLLVDTELVIEVYENLVSNAVRYAESYVQVECGMTGDMLAISVLDDGRGFTDEALRNAVQPFFRDDKEPDKLHFGLGLYICRILCEKCGGGLTVENHENGGKVTATFCCKKISESR